MDIIIVGHITHDHYDSQIIAGGCVFYGAKTYQQLGARVDLIGVVGEDFRCQEDLMGMNIHLLEKGLTTSFVNCYPKDSPRIQFIHNQAPMISPHDFEHLLPMTPDVVHLTPVLGEIDLVAWKESVKPRILAINVQGWIKTAAPDVSDAILEKCALSPQRFQSSKRVMQTPWAVSEHDLQGIDVACLSHEDLIGQGDLLARLCAAIPVVALTFGDKGCVVFEKGKPTYISAYATEAVDPTGAGDVFAAAFIYTFARGESPIQAARMGAATASIIVEGIGASTSHRLGEALERVQHIE